MNNAMPAEGLIKRVACRDRQALLIHVDGQPAAALAGDTVLVALLANGLRARESEFGDGPRAGFCLMGVCQDCWVTLESGTRIRACTTPAEDGMRITTGTPWLVRP